MKKGLIWFRNDLRIHDNEALFKASQQQDELVALYCFDPRFFEDTKLGFPRTSANRAKFILECVENLKNNLNKLGCELIIAIEKPELFISAYCASNGIDNVYYHKETGTEERLIEEQLENYLLKNKIQSHSFWGDSLYHRDDLPITIQQLPEVFSSFRKKVEKESQPRYCFTTPDKINPISGLTGFQTPSLFQLGLQENQSDKNTAFPFEGGEEAALSHLEAYIWTNEHIKTYKETRNGLIGANYSSKFSPWLSQGCISPRKIFEEVKKYEKTRVKNRSTYWLIFELIWRDFFKFNAQKIGSALFYLGGVQKVKKNWSEDKTTFKKWCEGQTGIPFIDANMRELKRTGFMSNRGRQNVASFLTKDLEINWLWGAKWFESQLIDHDVASNYGNWQYVAGLGADPREDRYFNVLKQAKIYDKAGDFTRLWLPELSKLDQETIHQVFQLEDKQKNRLGLNYPEAIKIPDAFADWL